jgi:hypothetical protein
VIIGAGSMIIVIVGFAPIVPEHPPEVFDTDVKVYV